MILSCNHVKKAFGEQEIISTGSFHIEDNEKAALVGINGAGKSTLLKIIMGEIEPDAGQVTLAKDKTIGYLSQHQEMDSNNTILDEIAKAKEYIIELEQKIRDLEQEMKHLSSTQLEDALKSYHKLVDRFEQENGYAYKSELVGVLKGLGFSEEDFSKRVNTLSGGQKTRVSLGKLLLTKPDLLLLDEPTNHLDMNSIMWLETYLLNYKGAVLLVSHDRYFINKVVKKVIEIDFGTLMMFSGNYQDYSYKKKVIRENKLKEYLNQQEQIKHQEAVIEKLKSFNREKSIKRAESREKALNKIERVEKPIMQTEELHFHLEPSLLSGNDVLCVEGLSKSFSSTTLFSDLNFEIKRGEHVSIIGDNGTGKTTILKILNEVISADAGSFTLGSNVQIGYYDQEHHVLNMEKTIFQEISDAYPDLTSTKIRNTLAAFLFTADDVYKRIKDLSGGERGRVSLAKLMLSEANFLILDEPTNHLDVASKEILEKALNDYTGTILYVSHDRYFINQTATRILDLVNGVFVNYIGNYDYYLEKKEELTALYAPSTTQEMVIESKETKNDWKLQKEQQTLARKKATQLRKTEEEITKIEEEISNIDFEISKEENYSDPQKCLALSNEKEVLSSRLETLYSEWENLSE